MVAVAQDNRCLALDFTAPTLAATAEQRSLETMIVKVEPDADQTARLILFAIFTGPSPEAPTAVDDAVYRGSYACVAGPVDSFAEDFPVWVQNGGWLCATAAGAIELQLVDNERGTELWTTGTTLPPATGADTPTLLTTRGNVAVGYTLIPAEDPSVCGF
jgi:hypothetical protein